MRTEASRTRRRLRLDELFIRADREWEAGRLKSAFRLLLAGAKAGDPSSQANLGTLYSEGLGVKQNRERALYWYRRAYRHGDSCGANNIGVIFRDEGKLAQAIKWFERAVELKDCDANLELAKIYIRRGQKREAIRHLKRVVRCRPMEVTQASIEEAQMLLGEIA